MLGGPTPRSALLLNSKTKADELLGQSENMLTPIASVLVVVAALLLAWAFCRSRLANRRSLIETLDGRVKARDEEIEFLRRERDANLIDGQLLRWRNRLDFAVGANKDGA